MVKHLILILCLLVYSCYTIDSDEDIQTENEKEEKIFSTDSITLLEEEVVFSKKTSKKLYLIYSLININENNLFNLHNINKEKRLLKQDSTNKFIDLFFTVKYPFSECDEIADLKKINDSCFVSSAHIDHTFYNFCQKIKITPKFPYDSVVVYNRYQNKWGFVQSETEGNFYIDTPRWEFYEYAIDNSTPDFDYNYLIYNSEWQKVEKLDSITFDLKNYLNFYGYWENKTPPMTIEEVKKFDAEKLGENFYPPYKSWQALFVDIEFRIDIYYNYQYQTIFLFIPVHYGEC